MILNRNLLISILFVLLLSTGGAMAGGDATRGEQLAVDCADCHGEDGRGDEDIPSIAGMDAAKHVKLLLDFKSGELESVDMIDYVEDMSEQDMADLAAYFATLPE